MSDDMETKARELIAALGLGPSRGTDETLIIRAFAEQRREERERIAAHYEYLAEELVAYAPELRGKRRQNATLLEADQLRGLAVDLRRSATSLAPAQARDELRPYEVRPECADEVLRAFMGEPAPARDDAGGCGTCGSHYSRYVDVMPGDVCGACQRPVDEHPGGPSCTAPAGKSCNCTGDALEHQMDCKRNK